MCVCGVGRGRRPSIDSFHLQGLRWIHCPSHVGMPGNDRSDRLASIAPIAGTITTDKKRHREDHMRTYASRRCENKLYRGVKN